MDKKGTIKVGINGKDRNGVDKDVEVKNIKIDPNTSILMKFDDGDNLKSLFSLLDVLLKKHRGKSSSKGKSTVPIFFVFIGNYIQLYQKIKPVTSKIKIRELEIFCKIKQYKLTCSTYKTEGDLYILPLEFDTFFKNVKLCNKSNYFLIEKKPGENYIRTSVSPNDRAILKLNGLDLYEHAEERSYKSKHHPVCVVTGEEFSALCSYFSNYFTPKDEGYINVYIYEGGLTFATSKMGKKNDDILHANMKNIGNVDDKKLIAKCYVFSKYITRLTKLKNTCAKANVLFYAERDEKGVIKPLKLVYPIGNIGKTTIYIGIDEYEDEDGTSTKDSVVE